MSLNILFLPIESEARNIERVSVDNSGEEGNAGSIYPSISSDGRYVAFDSYATNLVIGDTNTNDDMFVSYTVSGTSVPPEGGGGSSDGGCFISTSADVISK